MVMIIPQFTKTQNIHGEMAFILSTIRDDTNLRDAAVAKFMYLYVCLYVHVHRIFVTSTLYRNVDVILHT